MPTIPLYLIPTITISIHRKQILSLVGYSFSLTIFHLYIILPLRGIVLDIFSSCECLFLLYRHPRLCSLQLYTPVEMFAGRERYIQSLPRQTSHSSLFSETSCSATKVSISPATISVSPPISHSTVSHVFSDREGPAPPAGEPLTPSLFLNLSTICSFQKQASVINSRKDQ